MTLFFVRLATFCTWVCFSQPMNFHPIFISFSTFWETWKSKASVIWGVHSKIPRSPWEGVRSLHFGGSRSILRVLGHRMTWWLYMIAIFARQQAPAIAALRSIGIFFGKQKASWHLWHLRNSSTWVLWHGPKVADVFLPRFPKTRSSPKIPCCFYSASPNSRSNLAEWEGRKLVCHVHWWFRSLKRKICLGYSLLSYLDLLPM